jgi:hypothetical protein
VIGLIGKDWKTIPNNLKNETLTFDQKQWMTLGVSEQWENDPVTHPTANEDPKEIHSPAPSTFIRPEKRPPVTRPFRKGTGLFEEENSQHLANLRVFFL